MAENKDAIIVAIELGTSHISGIAGKRVNGNMQILAYAEEPSAGCVRRGIVNNIDKTTQCIKNVVEKLQTSLGKSVSQVYVGLGGQSVRSIRNKVDSDLMTNAYITAAHIEELRKKSFDIPYTDCERLDTIVQGYTIDGNATEEPVGVMGEKIEGEYLNIVARHQLRNNIETCFNNTDVRIVGTRISAFELAENVLSDQEKRAGCALVNLGAGTTTVVIYKNNIVRHLVTLPLGMDNITQDLTLLQVETNEAEQIKLKYGNAYPDENNDGDNDDETPEQMYTTSYGQTHKVSEIEQIIAARLMEITKNVENQILQSGYGHQLIGGIVLTGGGANMKNIDKAFSNLKVKAEKIRIARTLNQSVIKNSNITNLSVDNCMSGSIISLLISGEENCVGDENFDGKDMFKEADKDARIGAQKRAGEEDAKKENEMVERLENYKDEIRKAITELDIKRKEVEENGKDKKLRERAMNQSRKALEMQDDGFKEAISILQKKDKYKQTVKEAHELSTLLANTAEQLNKAVEKAEKENSFWQKVKKTITDLAED